ncbi:MAG: ATP-binding cassette domain-containing protein [bacterium]
MPILETNDLTKKYPIYGGWFRRVQDYDTAVDNVDLTLREKEVLGLVGESGSGKSTLAELLLKLEHPNSGRIYFRGDRIDTLSQRKFRSYRNDIQIVFQDPQESFDPRYTVEDCIEEGLQNLTSLDKAARKRKIRNMIDQVNLGTGVLDKYPHQLSGGQRQRVGIARALVLDPAVIVWDEPTSALDVSIQAQIVNLLLDLKEEFGLTYLFISHDLNLVKYVSDRIAVMNNGTIVERGPANRVYNSPKSKYTHELLEAAEKHRPTTS